MKGVALPGGETQLCVVVADGNEKVAVVECLSFLNLYTEKSEEL